MPLRWPVRHLVALRFPFLLCSITKQPLLLSPPARISIDQHRALCTTLCCACVLCQLLQTSKQLGQLAQCIFRPGHAMPDGQWRLVDFVIILALRR
jgi:hypothetical protein